MKQITTDRNLNEEEYNIFKQIYKLYTVKELSEMFAITQKKVKKYLEELGVCEEIPDGMKKCSRCNEILPLDCFANKIGTKDGKYGYCKTCVVLMRKSAEQKRRQEYIDRKINQFREKHKHGKFFCKKCNKEKTLEDYNIRYHFKSDGLSVYKKCKECEVREQRKRNLQKVKDKGFYY